MDNISNVRVGPLPNDSPYMKPFRLHFNQNGREKNWGKIIKIKSFHSSRFYFKIMQFSVDLVKAHDSVSIITFNTTRNTLVVVKQFRPAVYYGQICEFLKTNENIDSKELIEKFPPKNAVTMELCAGIVDKDLPFIEIAREELIEECGYNVPVERLEEIIRFRAGVGTTGSLQVMYYVEVSDSDKVAGAGGGIDDELIDVYELTLDETREMMKQGTEHSSPPGFLFGLLWFLNNKAPKSS